MNVPWSPVIFIDITGSLLMLVLSCWCTVYSWQLAQKRPDDVFRNYLFLFTLAIIVFAVSRSFGHLIKELLLLNDLESVWNQIAPFSGAVNSMTFVVIFAFGISFHRFRKVHAEIEYYKNNLEEMITVRTEELEKAKNTLENILNNSNPINITSIDFDLIQANEAYYALWPRVKDDGGPRKCFESRPGEHCHTDNCPLKLIMDGQKEVVQEVSKNLQGVIRDFIITARPFFDIDGKLIGMVESFQDITLRKKAEKSLLESEERFRKIFEANPDPVILARLEDGAVIDVNKAFALTTGISRLKALGHTVEQLGLWIDRGAREPFRELLKDSAGTLDNFEADFRVKDRQIKTGLVSARILHISDIPCILMAIRDISREKAAERALIEMDRMKSELISTAAHELNTPLSAILGYAELLLTPDAAATFSAAQRHDFLKEIYDRGEALSSIINNLLDISRIESGHAVAIDLQETDFTIVLRKSLEFFRLHDKTHLFRLDLPAESGEPMLRIDRHRVNQVLENLLSNAVKYSPKGTEIVLKGRRDPQGGWEVCITDQGIGMTPEQVDRVYDKFYRADVSNTAIGGLGLGMSIVKQIIEAHNGSIQIESAKGQGTTVIFSLPGRRG